MTQVLKIITPGDKILTALILILGVSAWIGLNHYRQAGDTVTIEVNGKVVRQADLHTSQQITVTGSIGKTIIKIDRGTASVIHSDCSQKICVKTGKIHRIGEMIVCVPNKVVIKINGQSKNQFDVITQ